MKSESGTAEPNPKLKRAWITRDGGRVLIGQMTGDHARNALAMVMDIIDKGHPVWTHPETGQFKYDSTKVVMKPLTVGEAEILSTLEAIATIRKVMDEDS